MKNLFTSVCRQLLLLLYSMICFGLAQAQSPPKADTLPNGVIVNKAALNDLAKSLEIQNKTELAVAQKLLDDEKKAGVKPKKPFRRTSILAGLDPVGRPLFYHTKDVAQAVSINTSKAWAGGGLGYDLSGRNVRMAVWEPGIARVTHQEFGGRAVWADPTTGYSGLAVNQDDHATHVSGIMAAGAAVARAKGMAYRCSLRVFSANNDVAEMTAEAALGLLVSNHSYGPDYGWIVYTTGTVPDTLVWQWDGDTTVNYNFDWRHGYYDAKSRNVDQVCVNAPYYLPFIAAGNETGAGPHKTYGFPAARRKVVYRNGTSRIPPARYPPKDTIDNISGFTLAKNPIVIGSVDSLPPNHAVPLAGGVRSDFSCIGPADDGRIKPDVCAHGRNVYSAFKANNTSYGFMSGTSQASPSGAGSGAMLQEHYRNIYSSYMRAPTLKGLIIHTADESGANPGPDYYMGYGVMNTGKAASVISGSRTSQKHKILEKTLANGIRDTIKGLITKGGANNPIRVTLSWYDTQIAPLPANRLDSIKSHLVADLDVRMVRKSDGKLYLPWVLDGRRPNRTNPARKGNDTVNVVEVIDTNVAPAGEYYVVVSHKRTLAGPQPYSLIITGFGDTIQASQSTLGNSLVGRVQLSNLDNNSFPAACNSYSDFTYLFANLCSGKKYKIKVSTGTCVSSATKIIKAYLDYNNDQYLDEATEKIVESDFVAGNTTWEKEFTVSAPVGMTSDYFPRLRIVMREVVPGENLAAAKAATRAYGTYARGETEDYSVRLGVVNQNYNTAGSVTLDSTYSYVSVLNPGVSANTGNKTVKVYCGCSVSNGAQLIVERPMKMYHDFELLDTAQLVFRVPYGLWSMPDSGAIRSSAGSKMKYSIDAKYKFDFPSYAATRSGNAFPDTAKDLWINGTAAGQSFQMDKNIAVTRELEIYHATYNLNGKTMRLLAGPWGTARLGQVKGTGNIAAPGSFISNVYVPGNAASWRFLSMPYTGKNFDQWTDNFKITSPIAGSSVVDADKVRCTIFRHMEGADVSDETYPEVNGWRIPANNALTPGVGFRLWMNSTFFQGKKTVDVTGIPIIGSGADATQPFAFTLTNTPTGYNGGGWNFLGNPFLSPIDWDGAGWTLNGVDNQLHTWRGAARQYASYAGGIGVNGGTQYIANQQGFFVHANNGAPTLSVSELAKPLYYVNAAIARTATTSTNSNILRIKLQAAGMDDDEAVFRQVEGATTGFDSNWDANKLPGNGLNLACRPVGGPSYAICAYPLNSGTQTMPLSIGTNPAGSMSLKFENVNSFVPPAQTFLTDHYLNTVQEVTDNMVYVFQVSADPSSQGDSRLELSFFANGTTPSLPANAANFRLSVWPNPGNGTYALSFGQLPAGTEVTVELTHVNGQVVQKSRKISTADSNTLSLQDLPNGIYLVKATCKGTTKIMKVVKE